MTGQLLDAVSEAVKTGNVAQVTSLLKGGADGNARSAEGTTPLMLAAASGNLGMVQALLAAGVDVKTVDALGWSALMKAIYNSELDQGFPDVVQVLIDAGADLETTIVFGTRPLMLAAGYGEAAVVEVLIKAGAEVKAKNEGGRTALRMVKDKDYVDVINLLHEAESAIEDGASCGSRNTPSANVVTFLKPGSRH